MSSSVRLPAELREFLGLPGPQSLLLRGPPGSGKTTLTLALLEAFPGDRFLVTSRVSGQELDREFPWLGTNAGNAIHVLDTSQSLDAPTPEKGAPHFASLLKEDDASLRDLRTFMWLPPTLQDVWSNLDPNKPTMVVIDSWDALVEGYLGNLAAGGSGVPERQQLERVLLRRMASSPVHLVLVLEREEQSQLDYLTNAVVQTQIDLFEERLERWLRIRKVRGVRIENTLYPYTLEGGKFDAIEPLGPYRSVHLMHHEPEPDAMPGYIWPGSRAYAESFGRLAVGRMTLIELDAQVPRYVPEILLAPLVAHTVEKGGPALLMPETQPEPEEFYRGIKEKVPKAKFLQLVRFMTTPPAPGASPAPAGEFARTVLYAKPPDPSKPGEEAEATKFLKTSGTPGTPAVVAVSITGIYAMAASFKMPITPEVVAAFSQAFTSGAMTRPYHVVIVGRSGVPLFEGLRSAASTHLRVRSRQGRALVYGVMPWTHPYLLTEGQDPAPYGLLRVI